jgi:hypothetical protein
MSVKMLAERTTPAEMIKRANIHGKHLLSGATILSGCWRMAALPMRISPLRLGITVALIGLSGMTTPAHARRVRNADPQNQQPPGQPMNIGDPQPAPAPGYNQTSAPYGNQNAYRTGAVQPAYTPNINNQARPQYQPNAYNPAMPSPYNQPAPNPAMSQRPADPPPSGQAAAAGNSNSFTVADQYPARPPRVSFRNGQLTILAENSTLPDILAAIHQRTGAALELPSALGTERVAAKLGPASTGEVLAELLNGSRFDYIVLNRLEDPSSPERIILREKTKADSNNANNNGYNNGGYNNGYNNVANGQPAYQPVAQPQEVPETVPEEEVPEEQPQPEPAVQPGGDQNNPGNAKTPEQLLEELRQLQQQRGQQPNQPQMLPQQPPLMDNNEPQ